MKLKRLWCIVLTLVMVASSLGGIIPVMAADTDPTVRNPDPKPLGDGVVLSKTAKSVPGWANKWEVTLKIEAPVITATSDTVLVIDKSWSMSGNPISDAKVAAKSLAETLLPSDNQVNRIAVVSFSSNANTSLDADFSKDYSTIESAIDGITVSRGTFTQKGLHMAADLINNSTATYKNIVLLSDGAPSYSYGFINSAINDNNNFVTYGNAVESSAEVESSVFGTYNSVVGGNGMRACIQYSGNRCIKYYNHGHSAIAEAGYINGADIHTIAFNAGAEGETVLEGIASSSSNYHSVSTADELKKIFDDIAGKIYDSVNSTHVHDVMGEGVIVEDVEHSTELDWDPKFTCDTTTCVATYTYEVEAGEHILDENSPDGFHPLNADATLNYQDADGNVKEGEFPVPYVKPFFINVLKEVDGQECASGECVFNFKIEHPAGEKTTEYTIEPGEANAHRIVEAFPIGNYTLTEIGTNDENPVKFENYVVSYTGNVFAINEQHADHIDVIINNKYETTSISATKKWDDNDNQDGLRENYDDLSVAVKDGDNYVDYKAVTGADDQAIEFDNLPKNRRVEGSGGEVTYEEITYKLVEATGCSETSDGITCSKEYDGNHGEISIDDDYTTEVTGSAEEGFVITNSHEPATVKIIVNKDWDDDNNRDGLRTENKQVEFCVTGKVGEEIVYEKSCQQASSLVDEIEIEFTGLPKYHDDGQEVEYIVEESEFFGYNATGLPEEAFKIEDEKDLDVTNTHTPETTTVLVKKIWDDESDNDRRRPDDITVTLAGDDEDVSATIKESDKVEGKCDEWCIEIPGLHKNKQGQPIEYTVSEDAIEGYTLTSTEGDTESGFTLTNSYQPETVTISVDKSWDDDNNRDGLRNGDSTVRFCVTGYAGDYTSTPECKTVLTGVGAKTDLVTFENLYKYHDGVEINYEVTEVEVLNGYTSDLVPGEYVVITDDEGTKVVTNTHEPEKISFIVQKVWDDEDDKDGVRPNEITVNVTGGEEEITLVITENDSVEGKCKTWCTEVTDLYKYSDGSVLEYAVNEEEVADYETTIAGSAEKGFIITNTHTPEPEPEPEPEPDPCADGGCGGEDITPITPITPETGRITLQKRSNAESSWINNFICITIVTLVSTGIFAFKKYKEKQLTK